MNWYIAEFHITVVSLFIRCSSCKLFFVCVLVGCFMTFAMYVGVCMLLYVCIFVGCSMTFAMYVGVCMLLYFRVSFVSTVWFGLFVMRVEHALSLKWGISTYCIILIEYLKVGKDLQATVSY